MGEYPQKDSYKLSEVCQYTDTQPYVLRFWESEFPQLSAGAAGGGTRSYSKEDIDLVQRIKQLLYEEEYTLAGARKKLEDEASAPRRGSGKKPTAKSSSNRTQASRPASAAGRVEEPAKRQVAAAGPTRAAVEAPRQPLEPRDVDSVPRQRYEDAVDEIEHLRLKLKEAENCARKAENALEELRGRADLDRRRAEKAIERMERLMEMLS